MIEWFGRHYYYIRVQTALFGWRWIIGDRSQKADMVKYRAFIVPWHKKYYAHGTTVTTRSGTRYKDPAPTV